MIARPDISCKYSPGNIKRRPRCQNLIRWYNQVCQECSQKYLECEECGKSIINAQKVEPSLLKALCRGRTKFFAVTVSVKYEDALQTEKLSKLGLNGRKCGMHLPVFLGKLSREAVAEVSKFDFVAQIARSA